MLVLGAIKSEDKPWALGCGHIVCGGCIDTARARKIERGPQTTLSRHDTPPSNHLDSDPEYELPFELELEEDEIKTRSKSKGKKRAKSSHSPVKPLPRKKFKPQPSPKPTHTFKGSQIVLDLTQSNDSIEIENIGWIDCPVPKCDGNGTDLLAENGSVHGPWELFPS